MYLEQDFSSVVCSAFSILQAVKNNVRCLTLLKQAKTRGTESWGPSTPGMKSMRGPIQLNGLTIVNSKPFSAPSPAKQNPTFNPNVIPNPPERSSCHKHLCEEQLHIISSRNRPTMSRNRNPKPKHVRTINEPLDQLFSTCVRPSLLVSRAKDARSLIFLQHVESRILQ